MDKQNDILALSKFARYADESFLITLANKGLYNRALKDIGSVKSWGVICENGAIKISFDDIAVTLNENIAKSTCSCPSKTVCKHIIMAILYTKEHEGTPDSSEDYDPYSVFTNIDIKAFRKKAGKKLYESSAEAVLNGVMAEFSYDDMLSCRITDDGTNIYFPKDTGIEEAVCKCGTNPLCRHKVIAALHFLTQNAKLIIEQEDINAEIISSDDAALLIFARDFIVNIFKKGISLCSDSDIDTCSQLATRLASENIDNIAKLFRSLASSIENMAEKNAAFSQSGMTNILCKIYNIISTILKNIENRELIEKLVEGGRKRYLAKDEGQFIGIGAYPWETASGFAGITAYIVNEEDEEIYSYTLSQAGFYENTSDFGNISNLIKLYHSQSHWQNCVAISNISRCLISLKKYKSTPDMRISSSKNTLCNIESKSTIDSFLSMTLLINDYNQALSLSEVPSWDYFTGGDSTTNCLLQFSKIENIHFDKNSQILKFDIINDLSQSATLQITHSEINAHAFEYFKDFKGPTGAIFCRVRKKADETIITPISIISEGGIDNIYFGDKNNVKKY